MILKTDKNGEIIVVDKTEQLSEPKKKKKRLLLLVVLIVLGILVIVAAMLFSELLSFVASYKYR